MRHTYVWETVWMALLKYSQLKNQKQTLPDQNGALSIKIPSSAISYVNVCVGKLLNSMADSFGDGDKRNTNSRGPYTILMPAQKFEIGKRAAEVGSTTAMRHYAKNYTAFELNVCSMMHCTWRMYYQCPREIEKWAWDTTWAKLRGKMLW